MLTALTASAVLTPLERIQQGVVLIEDDRVLSVGAQDALEVPAGARVLSFAEAVLAPGLVDIHIHGGSGHDVMEASADALAAVETSLLGHGVTSYVPTTVTAPVDRTLAALEKLGAAVRQPAPKNGLRARPVGLHLEGPFISHAKRGVHPATDILPPSPRLLEKFVEASARTVRLITLAPELEEAVALVETAVRHGICVSLGHSDSDYEDAEAAVRAGARHATHTFNAMRPLAHRAPGILGAVLSDDRLTADIIADGVHIAPAVVKLFLAAKGPERAVLISDAISATGMPDGRYRLGTLEVELSGMRCTFQGRLAGSVLTLDRAVRNMMEFTGCDLRTAVRLASYNPARVIGMEKEIGVLALGARADVVVLSKEGEVVKTMIAGIMS